MLLMYLMQQLIGSATSSISSCGDDAAPVPDANDYASVEI